MNSTNIKVGLLILGSREYIWTILPFLPSFFFYFFFKIVNSYQASWQIQDNGSMDGDANKADVTTLYNVDLTCSHSKGSKDAASWQTLTKKR